jgi:hypothetical protein
VQLIQSGEDLLWSHVSQTFDETKRTRTRGIGRFFLQNCDGTAGLAPKKFQAFQSDLVGFRNRFKLKRQEAGQKYCQPALASFVFGLKALEVERNCFWANPEENFFGSFSPEWITGGQFLSPIKQRLSFVPLVLVNRNARDQKKCCTDQKKELGSYQLLQTGEREHQTISAEFCFSVMQKDPAKGSLLLCLVE